MQPIRPLAWRGRKRFSLLVLLTLLPTITMILLFHLERQRVARAHTQQIGLEVAHAIADQHETAINNTRQLLFALSQSPAIQSYDLPACTSLLAGVLARNPIYTDISLADENGEVIASGIPFRPDNVGDRRFFIQARDTRDFAIGSYVIGRRTGKPTVHLSQPLFDAAGKFHGVVFAGVDMGVFASHFISSRLPEGSVMGLTTAQPPQRTVLYRWPEPEKTIGQPLAPQLDQAINTAAGSETAVAAGADGVRRIYAIRRQAVGRLSGDILVLVGIPEAAMASGWGALSRDVGGPLLVLGLALLAIWFFGNLLMLSQIKRLVATTHAVAAGNLSARTGLTGEGGDVGEVAAALDSMADALAQRDRQRAAAEAAVLQRNRQLSVLSGAAKQINAVLEIQTVLRQLIASAMQLTGATAGAAGMKSGDQVIFSEHNVGGELMPIDYRFSVGQGVPGHVMATLEPYLTNDAEHDPYVAHEIRQQLGFHNLVDVPILSRSGELLGCFEIHDKPTAFDAVDVEMLRGLAASAAVAIENASMVQERRQSEANYRLLVENQTDLVVKVDPDGRFQFVSPSYCRLFGKTEAELIGHNFMPLVKEEDRAATEDAMKMLFVPPHSAYMEQRAMTVSGWRWLGWADTAVLDEHGGISAIIGVGRDITERKQMEQVLADAKEAAEAASQAKDRFLASLSHELRTPLTPVLATLSMLQDAPGIPADLQPDLTMMRRNVEVEAHLIDDLLDQTRIARGKLRMDIRTADAHELLRRAIDISCDGLDAPRLFVQTELAATDHTVRVDPTRLQQVLWNIIKNAMQYTPDGGTLSIRSSNPEPGQLQISFTDTGMGIDPRFLPRIFDAFEQATAGSSRRPTGLGLGMAISASIMHMLGGSIHAVSEGEGKGSTFIVQLPTCPAEAMDSQTPAPRRAPVRPLRILLVEDHAPTLAVLARLLRNNRHLVTTATSVHGAIQCGQNSTFDVLISDIGMVDGSGLEVMRWFAAHQPIPGIALSGYGTEGDIQSSYDAGFAVHLTKPIIAQRLVEAVDDVAATTAPVAS